jgi:hypothetical protein
MSAQPRRSGLRAPRGGRGNGNNNGGGGNNNNGGGNNNNNNNNNASPPPHAGMYSAANVNYMTRHSPSEGKYAGPCIKGTLKFTKDFQQFSHQANLHFKEARFFDLHNIYTGVEKRPVLLAGELQEDFEFREQCYDERVTLVLSCFQACITLYTFQNGEDALHISQQLDGINDPELYFLKIKELTSAGQMVDNIDSVMKLVAFAMKGPSSDHAQDYKEFNRLQSKVLQIVPAITPQPN